MDFQDIPWPALTVAAALIVGGLVFLEVIRAAEEDDGSEQDGPPPGPGTRILAYGGIVAGIAILMWAIATSF